MFEAHFEQASTLRRRMKETGAVWDEIEAIIEKRGLPNRVAATLVEAAFGWRITNVRHRRHAEVSATVASRDLRASVDAGLLVAHGAKRGTRYSPSALLGKIREDHRYKEKIGSVFAGGG